jgi:hypothetical protein
MKTTTVLAVLTVALAAALVPAFASAADPGATVQADLTQLSTDVKALHDTLLPDLAAVTAAAQKSDKTGTRAAVKQFRTDRRSGWQTVIQDRKQLRTDLKAARDANVTGLKDTVKAGVTANQALLKEVRQAAAQALAAVKALRGAGSSG